MLSGCCTSPGCWWPHGGPNATPVPASSLLLTQGCILLLPVLHTKPEVWGCPPAHFPSVPGRLRPSPTRTRRAGARGSSTPSGCRWRKTKGTEGPGCAMPWALCQTLPSSPGRGFSPATKLCDFFFPQLQSFVSPRFLPTASSPSLLPADAPGAQHRPHPRQDLSFTLTPHCCKGTAQGRGSPAPTVCWGLLCWDSALGLEPGPGPGETSEFFCKKKK